MRPKLVIGFAAETNNLNEITKANIGVSISEANKKMCNGSSEYLNLLNIFCNLI